MVPIGYPGIVHIESLHLDLYTSPAILSAIVGVINIQYNNDERDDIKKMKFRKKNINLF
jgi:hypothetical protein